MKYLILGGNSAGMSFAAKMRRNQPECEIVVIEERDYVSFGGCGLPYYVGGYVDDSNDLLARVPEDFQKQNIEVRINQEVLEVHSDNKTVKINDGTKVYEETYDKLIITTGASPKMLFDLEVDYKNVFTLTSKKDGEELKKVVTQNTPKKFAIIGSGFIGMELMDTLESTPHHTTVFTSDKYIMQNQFDYEVVNKIEEDVNKLENIEIKYNQNIIDISVNENIIVKTDKEDLEFDYVIIAIGFKPNSDIIQNVDKLKNGAIIVDENLKTSVDDIYAVGDVATIKNLITDEQMYVPLATTANKAGRALADILSDIEVEFEGMLGSAIIKILDYELGRVGLTEKQLLDSELAFKTKIVDDFNQTSHYAGQESIRAKIYYDAKTLVIYGIEMVGKKGVHGRLDAMSVVISNKMTTKQLGYIDFPYAPPFSRTWDFLNVVGNVSK